MIYREFAARIRYAMAVKGLKNKDIVERCEKLGYTIHTTTVSQFLSGRFRPTDERAELMAEVLGVDKEWLQGKGNVDNMQGRLKGRELEITLKNMNDMFTALSHDSQQILLHFLYFLSAESKANDLFNKNSLKRKSKSKVKKYSKHGRTVRVKEKNERRV